MENKFETWIIEDFKNATCPILKIHIDKFEVAEYKKSTMKGYALVPKNEMKFIDLKNSYAFRVFEKLRNYSTPKLIESTVGSVLIWDNYMMRLKTLKSI